MVDCNPFSLNLHDLFHANLQRTANVSRNLRGDHQSDAEKDEVFHTYKVRQFGQNVKRSTSTGEVPLANGFSLVKG